MIQNSHIGSKNLGTFIVVITCRHLLCPQSQSCGFTCCCRVLNGVSSFTAVRRRRRRRRKWGTVRRRRSVVVEAGIRGEPPPRITFLNPATMTLTSPKRSQLCNVLIVFLFCIDYCEFVVIFHDSYYGTLVIDLLWCLFRCAIFQEDCKVLPGSPPQILIKLRYFVQFCFVLFLCV